MSIDLDAIEAMTGDPYQYAQVSPEVTRGYLSALLAELRATTADLAVAMEVARERGEEVERLREDLAALIVGGAPDPAEVRALRAEVDAYHSADCYGTSCLNCARLTDRLYAADVEVEALRDVAVAARALTGDPGDPAWRKLSAALDAWRAGGGTE